MVSFEEILVHFASTVASRIRLRPAFTFQQQLDAWLSGLRVIPDPDLPPHLRHRLPAIYAEDAPEAAGIPAPIANHTFRATGSQPISKAALLSTHRKWRRMRARRTTKLDNRTKDRLTRGEI